MTAAGNDRSPIGVDADAAVATGAGGAGGTGGTDPATLFASIVPESATDWAEATIVGRAQDGDIDSFEILLRRYQAPIYRLAWRMVSDRGDAEDLVQETFVQVWRQLPTLTDPALFRRWLYQIATRRCLTVLRARRRRPARPAAADDLQTAHDSSQAYRYGDPSHGGEPAVAAQYAAIRRDLDTVLATLPADQRLCWLLREMHDLSYHDIAQVINLPVATVRGRIARARQNLTKGMSSWR